MTTRYDDLPLHDLIQNCRGPLGKGAGLRTWWPDFVRDRISRFNRFRSAGFSALLVTVGALAVHTVAVATDSDGAYAARQAYADAWWTGPIVAASASTLPHGHCVIFIDAFDASSTCLPQDRLSDMRGKG